LLTRFNLPIVIGRSWTHIRVAKLNKLIAMDICKSPRIEEKTWIIRDVEERSFWTKFKSFPLVLLWRVAIKAADTIVVNNMITMGTNRSLRVLFAMSAVFPKQSQRNNFQSKENGGGLSTHN